MRSSLKLRFNRNPTNLDDRETLLEEEIQFQLQEMDEFEKQCKALEKALKRFFDGTQATKKNYNSLIQWYEEYLQFHFTKERSTWLVEEFLITPVQILSESNKNTEQHGFQSKNIPKHLGRTSMFELAPPKPSHKRSSSQNSPEKPARRRAPESLSRSNTISEVPKPIASDSISLQDEIPQWKELLQAVVKLRTDLAENMDYLLLQAVIGAAGDYMKVVNNTRRGYEKARSDLLIAKTKLEKEKSKITLSIDPQTKCPTGVDIVKLFTLEKEQVRAKMIYEEYIIEFMDLLTSEKRNVDLGQSILKYLETQKRYYQRASNVLSAHEGRIASLGSWQAEVTEKLQVQHVKRTLPLLEQQAIEGKQAWKRLATLLTRPNGYLLSIILEVINPLCSTSRRLEILESIVYLFVSQLQPFPPDLAEYVHMATTNLSEEEFYNSDYASTILQFLHARYNIIGDNLRRYSSDEFLVFTAALTNVYTRSDAYQAAQ